jgi:beta-lactamase class A
MTGTARQATAALTALALAPLPFPRFASIVEAEHYAAHRLGRVSFAVMRTDGQIRGLAVNRQEPSASVVKAMLLAAYLRHHPHPDAAARATLDPMIRVSDNGAAERIYGDVGAAGLAEVGRLAHMTHLGLGRALFDTGITPSDQVRLFFHLDRVIPLPLLHYAKGLLSSIVDWQSWGIPAAARPRHWRVYFKGGWRDGLTHQSAQLIRSRPPQTKFALSVLTRDSPSMPYAEDTIAGITRILLRRYPHSGSG